jgi:serine/threonine protein kinase
MPLPRPPTPPTELLRRAEARLLARLPSAQTDNEATHDPDPSRPGPVGTDDDNHPRYRFGEVFATGGLGIVRIAEDLRLGRVVAVKELLRDSPEAQRRFALEAAITARLQHPGIVPLYDLGWRGSGAPFYCMKLVEGEGLDLKIAAATTLPARLCLIEHVIAVADAIAYAHEQNIIHRDLKPANVLVGRFGETVVIDWGLAKDLSGEIQADMETHANPAVIPAASPT